MIHITEDNILVSTDSKQIKDILHYFHVALKDVQNDDVHREMVISLEYQCGLATLLDLIINILPTAYQIEKGITLTDCLVTGVTIKDKYSNLAHIVVTPISNQPSYYGIVCINAEQFSSPIDFIHCFHTIRQNVSEYVKRINVSASVSGNFSYTNNWGLIDAWILGKNRYKFGDIILPTKLVFQDSKFYQKFKRDFPFVCKILSILKQTTKSFELRSPHETIVFDTGLRIKIQKQNNKNILQILQQYDKNTNLDSLYALFSDLEISNNIGGLLIETNLQFSQLKHLVERDIPQLNLIGKWDVPISIQSPSPDYHLPIMTFFKERAYIFLRAGVFLTDAELLNQLQTIDNLIGQRDDLPYKYVILTSLLEDYRTISTSFDLHRNYNPSFLNLKNQSSPPQTPTRLILDVGHNGNSFTLNETMASNRYGYELRTLKAIQLNLHLEKDGSITTETLKFLHNLRTNFLTKNIPVIYTFNIC